ncbi:sigma 54-interacting transcriptional regulator [Hyalangium versicolor]|uniref:sigma 54-interacting transcriptional regulator n=1 Tax=Hyalangium versicolor TaxID=2861190 RepID=UPI001CCF8ED6|nr:sigma 54-interacting transcriptional regulator [Hyalangium versicolor]
MSKASEVGVSTAVNEGGPSTRREHPPVLESAYLLVFESDSSRIVHLPSSGEVLIGRAENAQVRLQDTAISRSHARLLVSGDEAYVADLGSQNGTLVNGERIHAPRLLISGDVISLCGVTLIFHGRTGPRTRRPPLELGRFRQRVEEELERAVRYGRPVTLVTLLCQEGLDDAAATAIAGQLRFIDVLGRAGNGQLLILLPEVGGEAAGTVVARLVGARGGGEWRAGFACYPSDGCDVDTLLSGARSAASAATTGQVGAAAQTFKVLKVGNASVAVADPAMLRLYALVGRLAKAELPVLVLGETGTGKELAASALHHWSSRAGGPLVAMNCAALPEALVESELFGHEKGAFSGAVSTKEGLLATADGGTLFLDEVGELSLSVQAKLLRVLDTQRFTRVGGTVEHTLNLRLVSATNRDLEQDVKAGRFRQDLYFRLGAARLWLPPLRDRKLEVPILSQKFLEEACQKVGRPRMTITAGAIEVLSAHSWPGNVRELKNLMDFIAASVSEDVLTPEPLWEAIGRPVTSSSSLETPEPRQPAARSHPEFRPIDEEIRDLERSRIQAALTAAGGNKTRAAELIHMPLRTFLTKLKRYAAMDPQFLSGMPSRKD